MLLYGIIVLVAVSIISVLNIFLNSFMDLPWYHYVIATLVYAVAVFAIDAIVAILIRKMPEKHFDANKKFFTASKKELNFYKKIGVKSWKDHIPELGQFTDFHKDKIYEPTNNKYVSRFLLEASYGVSIHFWSIFFGMLIIFIDWRMFLGNSNLCLTIALPVIVVNAILNFLPICVLKTNIPSLKLLYKINAKRDAAKANKESN